ncbi:MAG TPA: NUDIX hydrolase [Candidatus Saccharimonadales bacterium]|nr:NUDIX hydrolase [Candidatus Saccharimonadales bacterium]
MSWTKIGEHEVLDHPRMHLVEHAVELPDGTATDYLLEINRKDYVTTIARYAGKFAMIRDYSYPNDVRLLQFSEGWIDEGESPEQAAVRELKEETGLRAGKIRELGTNLHDHRRSTASAHVMLAENIEDTGEARPESTEHGVEMVLLTEAEIWKKIASGEIIQKNALAAWAIYAAQSRAEVI